MFDHWITVSFDAAKYSHRHSADALAAHKSRPITEITPAPPVAIIEEDNGVYPVDVLADVLPIAIHPFAEAENVVRATPLNVKLFMVCSVELSSSTKAPEKSTVPPVIGT
jgi:hypothetical protein